MGFGYYGGPTTPSAIRYSADGVLDETFGDKGISRIEVPVGLGNTPLIALEMPGGKVMLVTSLLEPNTVVGDVALIRLNENGGLDTGFGQGGVLRIPLGVGANDIAADATLQDDGKIVIAATHNNDVVLLRVHPDGTLDTDSDSDPGVEFGDGGKTSTDVYQNSVDQATALVQDEDDFLVAAKSAAKMAILRFSSQGARDGTFGMNGFAEANLPYPHDIPNELVVQDDGKIVAVGRTQQFDFSGGYGAFALARFNSDGTLDTNSDADPSVTFGTGGMVTTHISNYDFANDAILLSDGRILVVGGGLNSSSFQSLSVTALYGPGGSLDESFGAEGIVTRVNQQTNRVLAQGDKAILFGTWLPGNDIFDLLVERTTLGPGNPSAARTLSLGLNKKTVVFGDKVKLSGNITSTENSCKSGVTVDIDPTPGAELQATTTSTGAYSINHKPKEKTTYLAAVAATTDCGTASAGPKVVKVSKKVTLTTPDTKVDSGKKITLTAQLAPCAGKQGQDMTLKKKTTGDYSNVGTKQVNDSCKATWSQTITKVTTFQATSPKQDNKHEAGTSSPLKITLN